MSKKEEILSLLKQEDKEFNSKLESLSSKKKETKENLKEEVKRLLKKEHSQLVSLRKDPSSVDIVELFSNSPFLQEIFVKNIEKGIIEENFKHIFFGKTEKSEIDKKVLGEILPKYIKIAKNNGGI